MLGLEDVLPEAGLACLTFRYSGIDPSEGTFGFGQSLDDVGAAVDWLRRPEVAMALLFAAAHPEVRRVLAVATTNPAELRRQYLASPATARAAEAEPEGAKAPKGPVHFDADATREWLQADPRVWDLREKTSALADRDILLVGGWDDLGSSMEAHNLPFYRALVDVGARNVRIAAFHDGHGFEKSRTALVKTVLEWLDRKG